MQLGRIMAIALLSLPGCSAIERVKDVAESVGMATLEAGFVGGSAVLGMSLGGPPLAFGLTLASLGLLDASEVTAALETQQVQSSEEIDDLEAEIVKLKADLEEERREKDTTDIAIAFAETFGPAVWIAVLATIIVGIWLYLKPSPKLQTIETDGSSKEKDHSQKTNHSQEGDRKAGRKAGNRSRRSGHNRSG